MFRLVSDKLEKFETEMRKARNWIVQQIVSYSFRLSRHLFRKLKPYLVNDFIKHLKSVIVEIDGDLNKEMTLRAKMISDKKMGDLYLRDSSIVN